MDVEGRVGVVTGGSSGIGAAVLQALNERGARCVSWDIGPGADIECDVTDSGAVERALAETVRRQGAHPSLLVAAAGIASVSSIVDLDVDRWRRVLDVNLTGSMLALRAVATGMIDNGLDGSVALISSVNGTIADPQLSAYSCSKAALNHLARIAAIELGAHGIRVNSIGPGPTETPMLAPSLSDAYVTQVAAATPLGRIGTATEVAAAIVDIMLSGWITGQSVMADGGSSLLTARHNKDNTALRTATSTG